MVSKIKGNFADQKIAIRNQQVINGFFASSFGHDGSHSQNKQNLSSSKSTARQLLPRPHVWRVGHPCAKSKCD